MADNWWEEDAEDLPFVAVSNYRQNAGWEDNKLLEIPVQTHAYNRYFANTIVSDKFQDSQVFAKDIREKAAQMLNGLDNFTKPDPDYLGEEFNFDVPGITYDLGQDAPELDKKLEDISIGEAPIYDDEFGNEIIDKINAIDPEIDPEWDLKEKMPTFGAEPPVIDPTVVPDPEFPEDPGAAPTVTDPEMPEQPELTDPVFEELEQVLPNLTEFTKPSFEGSFPEVSDSLEVPGELTVEYDDSYLRGLQDEFASELETKIKEKINDALDNPDGYGMSGLPPGVETAIYERAKARQRSLVDDKKQEIQDTFAQKGWAFPPGGMFAAWEKLDVEGLQKESDLIIEIMKSQVESAKDGFQKTLAQAVDLNKMLLGKAEALAKHGVDVGRYAIELVYKRFEAQVTKKQLEIEEVKARLQEFGERIRAEQLVLEKFKSELQRSQLEVSLKEIAYNIFAKKIEINKIKTDVYKSLLEAVRTKVSLDEARINVFNSRIKAYETKIRAQTEKYNAYRAKIAGEQAKVDVYKAQADAYNTETSAWSTKAQVALEELRSKIQEQQLYLDQYKTKIENQRVRLEGKKAEVDAQLRQYSGEVEMYRTRIDAEKAKISAQSQTNQSYRLSLQSHYQSLIEQARMNMQGMISSAELSSSVATSGANIASQLASSAMTAVNASAQISGSQNRNLNSSYQASVSRSDGVRLNLNE